MDDIELITNTDQKMDDGTVPPGESGSEASEVNHQIETLEAELSANPCNCDAYVQYVKILRKKANHEKIRQAREAMRATFPALWLEWAKDEASLPSSDNVPKIVKLYERGLSDYQSVSLWRNYLNFLLEFDPSVHGYTPDGISKMRSLFERAIPAVGFHVTEGNRIWEGYREFEQGVLATIDEADVEERNKQIQKIRNIFHRHLSVPLENMSSTLIAYKAWELEQGTDLDMGSDDLSKVSPQVAVANKKAQQMYSERAHFEGNVSKKDLSDTEKFQQFMNYIKFEQTSGDPTGGASIEEESLAKPQKSKGQTVNAMDGEDKTATLSNEISITLETGKAANSNKEETEEAQPVKLNLYTDESTALLSNLSAKAQGVSSGSLLNSELDSVEGPSNAPLGAEICKEKQIGVSGNFLEKIGGAGAVSSSSVGHVAVSSDSVIASIELEKNSLLQSSLDSNEVSRNASETICVSHDVSLAHNSNMPSLAQVTDNQDSDSSSRLSGGHGRSDKVANDSMTAHAQNEDKEDDKSHLDTEKRVKRRKKRRSSRLMTISQRLGAIDKTTADIDLGILDALEVATKVAQEVAREVDSGEASHSSSEELSDESGQSDSQHSHNNHLHTGSPSKRLSVGESHSLAEPHVGDDDVMDEKNIKRENGMVNSDDVKDKHLAEPAKSEVGREKSPCGFDLNDDICPDETDVIMSISNSGMPAVALSQLERSLSAKGSAASSVSHSELPHKVPSEDSRDKQVICIDLNVAEVGDDEVEDRTPWKQFPFSSSNSRGGESSHEANFGGSSRFNLDLNCTNEEADMPPPELKMETRLFLSHNGQQSASPLSSLLVAQQSGKEANFDLNDRPQFFIDSRDQGSYHGHHPWSKAPYGGRKLDEPGGLSILGAKVDVDRKDSVSQMASFLSNGKSLEPAAGLYMGKTGNSLGLAPGVSFSPAPIYGYNGYTGPPGMSMSSSPMYVPGTAIPYMVDARGTPVMVPQIIGSAPYAQPPFPQQHMFMSLSGGSPSMNGAVRPHYDQSSGFGVEMGNRESLSLRQFLSPGDMGEHSRASVEPSSSLSISIGGKRKEPETPRWEFPPPWR